MVQFNYNVGGVKLKMFFRRYTFLIVTGVESILVGLSFLVHPYFKDDATKPVLHAFSFFGGPWGSMILILTGFLLLVVGLLRTHRYHLDQIVLALGTGVWLALFMAYLVQDMVNPFLPPFSAGTVLIGFVVVRLLIESSLSSISSDDNGGNNE